MKEDWYKRGGIFDAPPEIDEYLLQQPTVIYPLNTIFWKKGASGMELKEIIQEGLDAAGFDGLCADECGCYGKTFCAVDSLALIAARLTPSNASVARKLMIANFTSSTANRLNGSARRESTSAILIIRYAKRLTKQPTKTALNMRLNLKRYLRKQVRSRWVRSKEQVIL